MLKISFTLQGETAERVLEMSRTFGCTPTECARSALLGDLRAYDYRRYHSRQPHAGGEPWGPDLRPGEAESIREVAVLAVQAATRGPSGDEARERLHSLRAEGL